MAAEPGYNGYVLIGSTKPKEVTNVKFTPKSNITSWGSADTPGYKKSLGGTKQGTGSFDCKVDDTTAQWTLAKEGDQVTLKVYLSATSYFTVPVTIDQLAFDVDIDNGAPVTVSYTFTSNGTYTYPT